MNCELHPEWPTANKCFNCNKPICAKCEPNIAAAEPKCENCRARRGFGSFAVGGISGWLLIPAIGLVLNVLGLLFSVPVAIRVMTGSGMAGTMYSFFTLAVAGLGAAAAFFFFQKKRITPMIMIAYYGLGALSGIYAMAFGGIVGGRFGGGLFFTLIWPAIWIPYFLMSKQVKLTFTND